MTMTMTSEELRFTFVKVDEEHSVYRIVCYQENQVIEIVESNMRNCINRQLELLQQNDFIKEKWRVRRD